MAHPSTTLLRELLLRNGVRYVDVAKPTQADDGGSSAEIKRVLGGPSIGDIRSRCMRLAHDHKDKSSSDVYQLLSIRLDSNDKNKALSQWNDVVTGKHPLFEGIHPDLKQIIKTFLIYFNNAILNSSPEYEDCPFDYRSGSVGNFLFTGMRMFFNSLESAIFLFSRVTSIPLECHVIPIINTNNNITIAVMLQDGTHIKGQHEISHPTELPTAKSESSVSSETKTVIKSDTWLPLPSKISKLYYINEYGQEFQPKPNSRVLSALSDHSTVIVYGMGSLYTSVIPSLVLQGVGEAIAAHPGPKILLLNGTHDRETEGMTLLNVIHAITNALNRYNVLSFSPSKFITHVIYTEKGEISKKGEEQEYEKLGILLQNVKGDSKKEKYFDSDELAKVLIQFCS